MDLIGNTQDAKKDPEKGIERVIIVSNFANIQLRCKERPRKGD